MELAAGVSGEVGSSAQEICKFLAALAEVYAFFRLDSYNSIFRIPSGRPASFRFLRGRPASFPADLFCAVGVFFEVLPPSRCPSCAFPPHSKWILDIAACFYSALLQLQEAWAHLSSVWQEGTTESLV